MPWKLIDGLELYLFSFNNFGLKLFYKLNVAAAGPFFLEQAAI